MCTHIHTHTQFVGEVLNFYFLFSSMSILRISTVSICVPNLLLKSVIEFAISAWEGIDWYNTTQYANTCKGKGNFH